MDDLTLAILALILAVLAPFASFGIYKAIRWVIEKIQIGRGYIIGRWILPNRREMLKIVKPVGKEVNVKFDKKEMSFNYKSDLLTYRGNAPIATWNRLGMSQLDLSKGEVKADKLSADDVGNLIIRAYNLGIISAMRDEKFVKLLLIIAVALMALGVVMGFMNWSATDALSKGLDQVAKDVATNTADIAKLLIQSAPVLVSK